MLLFSSLLIPDLPVASSSLFTCVLGGKSLPPPDNHCAPVNIMPGDRGSPLPVPPPASASSSSASLSSRRIAGSVGSADPSLKAPLLVNITGGHGEINVVWITFCPDGEPNTDSAPDSPCHSNSEKGVVVGEFEIILTDTANYHTVIPVIADVCNEVSCNATIPAKNYVGTHVQLRALFTDGRVAESCLSLTVFASNFATPEFLRDLYQIPSGLEIKIPNNTQAVTEFLEQYYNPEDLTTYLDLMGIPRQNISVLVGPNDEKQGSITGGESQLDIQVMMGMAIGASTWFWSVAGREPQNVEEPFLRFMTDLADHPNPPYVHSVSYGDMEEELPIAYTERLNVEFAKCGLRGLTLLFASGDTGITSFNPAAKSDDEGESALAACSSTHPEFPTSSPYVLSVGATQLSDHHSPICGKRWRGVMVGCSTAKEIVCSAATGGVITSGGGFSTRHARPKWQERQVEHYLQRSSARFPPSAAFNSSNRAYPDIAVYGTKYPIIMGGKIVPTAGTSASTPLMAAMITLWNDIRFAEGKGPLGFINPLLYKLSLTHPEVFNDVSFGDNACLLRDQKCCDFGFEATTGYDSVSGLGSPKFQEVAKLILSPKVIFAYLANSNPDLFSHSEKSSNGNPSVDAAGSDDVFPVSNSALVEMQTKLAHISWIALGVGILALMIGTGAICRTVIKESKEEESEVGASRTARLSSRANAPSSATGERQNLLV